MTPNMPGRISQGAWVAAAAAMSVASVLAFNAATSGPRTLAATVVNDADAFLAIEANAASPHKGFVSVAAGKVAVAFDAANPDAAGTGINPDSAYMFDSILKVTNKGTTTVNVDVAIAGADAALCQAALTAAGTQGDGDYSADPAALARAPGDVAYLGLRIAGTAKASGDAVACTIAVAATR